MVRISRLFSLLALLIFIASACPPIYAAPANPKAAKQSVVTDGAGPITTKDPAQAKAEKEFRAAAVAKERAYYAKDYNRLLTFYADNVISVQPGVPEIMGKVAWGEGMKPFLAANDTVGKLTIKKIWVSGNYATRYAEWDEVVTPKDGSKPFHQFGRCILGWQKINGEWKIVSEFINYLVPPTEIK